MIDNTFNNIKYKNSVVFVRNPDETDDDNLVIYNNSGMSFTSGINSNKLTKHVCDYGLLIANSPHGELDLTKKLDRCMTITSNINIPGMEDNNGGGDTGAGGDASGSDAAVTLSVDIGLVITIFLFFIMF